MLRISKAEETLADQAQQKVSLGGDELFWFDGDNTTSVFAMGAGWRPILVYVDGALNRVGSAEDYTVQFDGCKYSVVFAVPPTAVSVGVQARRVSS